MLNVNKKWRLFIDLQQHYIFRTFYYCINLRIALHRETKKLCFITNQRRLLYSLKISYRISQHRQRKNNQAELIKSLYRTNDLLLLYNHLRLSCDCMFQFTFLVIHETFQDTPSNLPSIHQKTGERGRRTQNPCKRFKLKVNCYYVRIAFCVKEYAKQQSVEADLICLFFWGKKNIADL